VPASQAAPRPNSAPRSGLFIEPSAPESAPAPGAAVLPRNSLFGIVTGAIRGAVRQAAPAGEPNRAEPPMSAQASEQAGASVRPAASDEMGLEIPAFLRRQSS